MYLFILKVQYVTISLQNIHKWTKWSTEREEISLLTSLYCVEELSAEVSMLTRI